MTTPYDAAANNTNDVTAMQVEYEASTNRMNNYGHTPINEARKCNNKEAVPMLEQL